MDKAIFELPKQDGIPVLSPLQRPIELGETLRTLRGQIDAKREDGEARRRVQSSLDRLWQEELEEAAFRELLGD